MTLSTRPLLLLVSLLDSLAMGPTAQSQQSPPVQYETADWTDLEPAHDVGELGFGLSPEATSASTGSWKRSATTWTR